MTSKESEVARALNELSSSNFTAAAGQQEWLTLVTDYFGDQVSSSSEEENDNSDVEGDAEDELIPQEDWDENDGESEQPAVTDVDEVTRAVLTCEEVCVEAVSREREEELAKIRAYRCPRCKLHNGASCILSFDEDAVYDLRMSMASLTDYEKDLVLLGKISCHMNNSNMTSCSKRKEQRERQHQRTEHFVNGRRVCRETFKFLHW